MIPNLESRSNSVAEDLRRLDTWGSAAELQCAGGVELVPLAKRAGCTGRGLAALSLELLGEKMPKGAVRTSDWEAVELSSEQIAYAANDARASLRVLRALHKRIGSGDSVASAEASSAISSAARQRQAHRAAVPKPHAEQSGATSLQVRIPKRRKPVYDGWLMLAPDGSPMCRMAAARGQWYLSRGLATLLPVDDTRASEAPGRTIQLKFQPNGPGNAAEPWLIAAKRNRCVGCGASDEAKQVRFSVVPHSFRRLLPARMKSRDSHDLVALCVACYAKVDRTYESHRAGLFRSFDISRTTPRIEKPDPREARVRSAALALTQHGGRLPEQRRRALEALVAGALGVEASDLTPTAVSALAQREPQRQAKADWVSPEQQLMQALLAEAGGDSGREEAALRDFTRTWREKFVDALEPRYLPEGWTTSHDRKGKWGCDER